MDLITALKVELPRIFKRYSLLFIIVVVVALASTSLYLFSQPTSYTAEAKLLVGPGLDNATPDLNSLRIGGELVQTYAEIAESRPLLQQVVDVLDLDMTTAELDEMVTVLVNADTRVMTIEAVGNDQEQVAQIANALADAVVSVSPSGEESAKVMRNQLASHSDELDGIINATEQNIRDLEQELTNLEMPADSDTATYDTSTRLDDLRVRLGDLRIQLSYALRAQAEIYNVLKEKIYDSSTATYDSRDRLVENAASFDQTILDMEDEINRLEDEVLALETNQAVNSSGVDVNEQKQVLLDQLTTERSRLSDSLLAQTNIVDILERTLTNEVIIFESADTGLPVQSWNLPIIISAGVAGLFAAVVVVWVIEIFREPEPVVLVKDETEEK